MKYGQQLPAQQGWRDTTQQVREREIVGRGVGDSKRRRFEGGGDNIVDRARERETSS